jgi:hypothetical protein
MHALLSPTPNLSTGQGRAIFAHKYTMDATIDVVVEKGTYQQPEDGLGDSLDDSLEDSIVEDDTAYFTAHLVIYTKQTGIRGGILLHTNPNAKRETLVDAMADLLDSLLKRAQRIRYVSATSPVSLEDLPADLLW